MIDVMVIVHLINKVFFCDHGCKNIPREPSLGEWWSRKHLWGSNQGYGAHEHVIYADEIDISAPCAVYCMSFLYLYFI